MFRFECELHAPERDPERSAYDLGHMTFEGDGGTCTSRGDSTKLMMLMISLSDLLQGVQTVAEKRQPEFTFIGAGSALQVRFQRERGDRLSVWCGRTRIAEEETTVIASALLAGARAFARDPRNALSGGGIDEGLAESLADFEKAFGH